MSELVESELSGSDVMLTGSSGFVGRRVAQALTQAGARVRCFPDPPADICDIAHLTATAEGCHAIVHLAGPPSVAASWKQPAEFARVHVQGTAAALEACRNSRASAFVHMSSAEIYGRPIVNPVQESAAPAPLSPYAVSKYAAEQLVMRLAPAWGIPATILRPFSIYGPGAHTGALIPTILSCLARGEPITLRDLRPVRDYCFVDDVAAATAAAVADVSTEAVRVFNIASGEGISVGELAERARAVSGLDVPIVEAAGMDRPAGTEIDALVADTGAVRRVLGWRATVDLDTGLRSTLAAMMADMRCDI